MSSSTDPGQDKDVLPQARRKDELRRLRKEANRSLRALQRQHDTALARAQAAESRVGLLQDQIAALRSAISVDDFRERRLKWIVPVQQPLLLISQIQRAGGTLMARLFDDHPSFFAHPYELKWGRPHKWNWPDLDLGLSPTEWAVQLKENWPEEFAVKGIYQKHSARPKWGVIDDLEQQPFLFSPLLQSMIFERMLPGPGVPSQRAVLDAHLTGLFNAWLDYQNLYRGEKRFVSAFTPRVNMHAASRAGFRRDYPDGYLLTIVREPLSWLASALKHPHVDFQEVNQAVDLWITSARGSIEASDESPDRTIVVLFEDVIGRTEEIMRRVSSRLEIEWSPSLCAPTYNGRRVVSDSSFVPSTGIDRSATNRHLTLDDATIEEVRSRTLPTYEQVRSRFGLPT